jgi:dCMP deaminase
MNANLPSKSRPSWDEYFMDIARTVANRATCPRANVGAIVVRDRRILTTGYNGSPPATSHCTESGCIMVDNHCLRATHAEANAIVQGARYGISIGGSTLYTTHRPCAGCAKLLISAGITRVVYEHAYLDPVAETLFSEAKIDVVR